MKPSRTRLYARLSLTHRNQWAALQMAEIQEKAGLYTAYRSDYARLKTETHRTQLLQQFTQEFLLLTQGQKRRRSRLTKRQRQERTQFVNTSDAPRIFP